MVALAIVTSVLGGVTSAATDAGAITSAIGAVTSAATGAGAVTSVVASVTSELGSIVSSVEASVSGAEFTATALLVPIAVIEVEGLVNSVLTEIPIVGTTLAGGVKSAEGGKLSESQQRRAIG